MLYLPSSLPLFLVLMFMKAVIRLWPSHAPKYSPAVSLTHTQTRCSFCRGSQEDCGCIVTVALSYLIVQASHTHAVLFSLFPLKPLSLEALKVLEPSACFMVICGFPYIVLL